VERKYENTQQTICTVAWKGDDVTIFSVYKNITSQLAIGTFVEDSDEEDL